MSNKPESGKDGGTTQPSVPTDKEKRLAEALRKNLRRRKAPSKKG